MGTLGGFHVFPPASEVEVRAAEERLGFPLPFLLKELYLKVGYGRELIFGSCWFEAWLEDWMASIYGAESITIAEQSANGPDTYGG